MRRPIGVQAITEPGAVATGCSSQLEPSIRLLPQAVLQHRDPTQSIQLRRAIIIQLIKETRSGSDGMLLST